jgi:hypothetical protein
MQEDVFIPEKVFCCHSPPWIAIKAEVCPCGHILMTVYLFPVEREGEYPYNQIDNKQGHQGHNKDKPDAEGYHDRHKGFVHG